MSAGIQISIRARANQAAQNFDAFVQESQQATKDGLREVAQRTIELVTTYPEKFKGPFPWVSERQRIYVMIHIALGDIVVPRPRSTDFARSWTIEEYRSGFRVRSTSPYARYVVGTATDINKQAYIHINRWMPLRVAVEKSIEEAPTGIQENIILAARRRGLKA